MEAIVRKPFQGVSNIIRFNWHFYAIGGFIVVFLFISLVFVSKDFNVIISSIIVLILVATFLSLSISYYVYDYSPLYAFEWLDHLSIRNNSKIVNINAGFDETSAIFKAKFNKADLCVFDFYDPEKHTEVSIERARKVNVAYAGTKQIRTDHIPLGIKSIDFVFNIFSIHEIRNRGERINFLKQQNKVLKDDGRCIVVEHLRDLPNFIAYNIGFLHFFSLYEWRTNFLLTGFEIDKVLSVTPFVSVFILKKSNGNTSQGSW